MDWSQNQIRLFRALLHCYPAEFRHEYGAEMEQLFAGRLQSESRLRLWIETLADFAISAVREHWCILAADVRYGAHAFAATPSFTGTVLLVIALGIGVTVAIFSLVNAVLLRSMPYGHPEKLVYLWSPNVNFKGVPQEMAPNIPDFYDWQRLSRSFVSTAILHATAVNLIRKDSNMRVQAAYVTGNFFRTLEAWPEIGRSFGEDASQPGSDKVAVISHALWRSQFDSDPSVLGKQIQINRQRYTVIGIMPEEFGYPFNGDIPYASIEAERTDLWLPLVYTPNQKTDRTNIQSGDAVIGRLRKDVSTTTAEDELKSIETRLDPLYPPMWRGWTALVRPLVQTIIGPVQEMLWLLLGAVGLVLLIAISNVANLLLARAAERAHELGIRTALGAERSRIVRQLLTESLMLSCVGTALGVALAYLLVHGMARLNPGDIPRLETATNDGRVLSAALVLLIATGLLSGLFPAVTGSRSTINELLKRGRSRASGTSRNGAFAFVVTEVALSTVLLAGSGLLVRSYIRLAEVDPGFSASTLTFRLHLDANYATPEVRAAFYKTFLSKLANMRGAKQVGASNSTPLSHHETVTSAEIEGFGKSKEMIENRSVTPGYRKALGTALLRGRDLDAHDVNSKTRVILVNQSFVNTFFPGRNPLGGRVRIGIGNSAQTPWSTIVGVVGNIRHNKLEEPGQPQIFQPADSGDNFAILCGIPAGEVITQSRAILRSLDPGLGLETVHTMGERMVESNRRRRFQTFLLTSFAVIAVTLALVGLYGLMSYAVKQRKAEIGIRLALGSSRHQVLRLILSQGLRLTAYGLILGLGAALTLTRLVSAWLFDVTPFDPVTFVAVPSFILVVACGASAIPAWSATRVDPVQTLRQE